MADNQPTLPFQEPQPPERRVQGGGKFVEDAAVIEAYQRLRSTRKVSKELGIHRSRVKPILARNGILKESTQNAWAHRKAHQQQLRTERKAKGLCRYCDKPVTINSILCDEHLEEYRRKKHSNRGKGICVTCKNPAEPGLSRCAKCLRRLKETRYERIRARAPEGTCTLCFKNPVEGKFKLCNGCREKGRTRLAMQRQQRQEQGLCDRCGRKPRTVKDKYCENCYCAIMASSHLGTVLDGPAIKKLWEECGGICAYSGRKLTLGIDAAVDHRVAITKGGSSTIDNLQWVHEVVNQMKRNYDEAEFLEMIADVYRHRCQK